MILKDLRENYQYYSGKASEIVRQLGLAGIAVIWVFKNSDISKEKLIPNDLSLPAALIVIGLGLDLLHYIAGTLIWGTYHRKKEKEGISEVDEIDVTRYINWPTLFFFILKIVSIIYAYLLIIRFLYSKSV